MNEQPVTPAEIATTEHLRLLLSADIEAWIRLFAEDATFAFPFAPEGMPDVLHGREEIEAHMRGFAATFEATYASMRFTKTADPHVAVAQFDVNGTARPTGRAYEQRCITKVTLDATGLISRFDDYWNPLAAIRALSEDDDTAAVGVSPTRPA